MAIMADTASSEPSDSGGNSGGDINSDSGAGGEVRQDRFVGGRDLTRWPTSAGRSLQAAARRLAAWLGPNAALIIILAVGLVVAVILSVVVAQIYDSVTDSDGVAGLDKPLLNFAMTLRSPVLDSIVTGYTNIAGPIGMPIIAVVALLILSIRRRSWTPAILILATGTGSLLMTIAGKDVIGRVRPPLADAVPPYEYSPSFPSGHSLNAVVIAGIIAYLLILRQHSGRARIVIIVIAFVFAITIGLSRVFLGHHWFTDVLAGWLLGALWLSLVITAHRLYLTARARHHALAK
jgi:membrane-associated phospholipid phosphatase